MGRWLAHLFVFILVLAVASNLGQLLVTRGAGCQGTQNGSISCIALPESLPGGVRTVLAENLIAAMLGLEVATGNDALASHSEMRKSAKLMLQFIPGNL